MKRLFLPLALLVAAVALCGDDPAPRLDSATGVADALKKEHPDKGAHLFAEGANATVNLINTSSPVPAHYPPSTTRPSSSCAARERCGWGTRSVPCAPET